MSDMVKYESEKTRLLHTSTHYIIIDSSEYKIEKDQNENKEFSCHISDGNNARITSSIFNRLGLLKGVPFIMIGIHNIDIASL